MFTARQLQVIPQDQDTPFLISYNVYGVDKKRTERWLEELFS